MAIGGSDGDGRFCDRRRADRGEISRVEESFEEPDVDDVADPVVALGERFGAGVQLLSDLIRDVETRHQSRGIDGERCERDSVGLDQFVMGGRRLVDGDLESGATELATLVADLQRHAPWPVAEPRDLDRYRFGLAGNGEAAPGVIGDGGVEAIDPFLDAATEDDIEVGGRTSVDAEAELHRSSTFDDEQTGAVVVADIVEHCADHTDADEVHDSLGELSDFGGMSLQEPLEFLGAFRPFGHDTAPPTSCLTNASCSDDVIAPRCRAVVMAWRAR